MTLTRGDLIDRATIGVPRPAEALVPAEQGRAAPGRAGPGNLAPTPGPVLFARYAYPPNLLGLCGPGDAAALLEGSLANEEPQLRELARGFEGAYPYLRLIAAANDIADPLDPRVVEAYWIGNELTERVPVRALHADVTARFRPRMTNGDWGWLEASLAAGSIPNHAFHVLAIFPRAGMLRSGRGAPIVETMDRCRIRWGRVMDVTGSRLIVAARHLEIVDGRLALGSEVVETVSTWRDASGPIGAIPVGASVSLHWDWVCDVLDDRRLRALRRWTAGAIGIANETAI